MDPRTLVLPRVACASQTDRPTHHLPPQVVDGQVCYPEGQVDNVYNVFKDRIMMFQNVYVHR